MPLAQQTVLGIILGIVVTGGCAILAIVAVAIAKRTYFWPPRPRPTTEPYCSDFYRRHWCIECDHPLSKDQVWDSDSVCPYCGHDSRRLHSCNTRSEIGRWVDGAWEKKQGEKDSCKPTTK